MAQHDASNPYQSPNAERITPKSGYTAARFGLAILAVACVSGYIVQTRGAQISVIELSLLLVATGGVAVVVAVSKRIWLFGIPAIFAIATSCSPPDLMSTLAIAVPCCCVYAMR